MTKICGKCKIEKNVNEFNKQKSKPDGLQAQCRDCRKNYNNKHYINNKDIYAEQRKTNRNKLMKEIKDIKKELSCKVCGEYESVCLDFHHLDSSNKEFSISAAIYRVSKEKLLQEISKCIVLCSNCHRKIHAGIIKLAE